MGNVFNKLKPTIAKQLKEPRRNPFGMFLLNSGFPRVNGYLEENAVKLCEIQPHHNVLEIGFGPGIGLEKAFPLIKDGPGKLHGVDWSTYCCEYVTAKMKNEIESGSLSITSDSVMMLPFEDNHFDRIFHTNCFYFWTNMEQACGEIYRVMKPGSFMVTCMNMKKVKEDKEEGYFENEQPDPLNYMLVLERVGFADVKVNYLKDEGSGKDYEAIIAHVREKNTHSLIDEIARQELTLEQEALEAKMN